MVEKAEPTPVVFQQRPAPTPSETERRLKRRVQVLPPIQRQTRSDASTSP